MHAPGASGSKVKVGVGRLTAVGIWLPHRSHNALSGLLLAQPRLRDSLHEPSRTRVCLLPPGSASRLGEVIASDCARFETGRPPRRAIHPTARVIPSLSVVRARRAGRRTPSTW